MRLKGKLEGRQSPRGQHIHKLHRESHVRLRDDFGVRRIDPKKRVYWIEKGFYHESDYVEFERDSSDKAKFPYYWSSDAQDEIKDLLHNIAGNLIHQRKGQGEKASLFERRQPVAVMLDQKAKHLDSIYGIQIDVENRQWRLKQKSKLLPLQHKILRQELATLLLKFIRDNNFRRVLEDKKDAQERSGCRVYARALKIDGIDTGQVTLRIRSSIQIDDESEVTESGGQAIQVYVEYNPDDHWDYERIIFRAPKIMRVGELSNIMKRLGDRVEEAQAQCVDGIEFCKQCKTAPLFRSTKGNKVCCHFCWTKTLEERKRYMEKEAAAATAAADK